MNTNDKQFYFEREPGKFERVQQELWQWEALYSDGSILRQFDQFDIIPHLNGCRFHQIKEIDQSKLQSFKMVSPQSSNVYIIHFDPETMQLFHKYTHYIINAATPEEKRYKTYHFGYKQYNHLHAVSIMPDGNLIISADPDKIQLR